MSARIDATFARLKAEGRAGLATFVTAGDPDAAISAAILARLPAAGADIVELGMPFSDPMADGPAIQASSRRALKAGQTLARTLEMARAFRAGDAATPLVLMGYYNPIYSYGRERFLADALGAGVDALIVVDLPPEEDEELCLPALAAGLPMIRLATPTTDDHRLDAVLRNTSGFLYYVSVTGITGTRRPDASRVREALERVRRRTALPIAVGFGVRTPEQAAEIGAFADAVVVGSALVEIVARNAAAPERAAHEVAAAVESLAAALKQRGAAPHADGARSAAGR